MAREFIMPRRIITGAGALEAAAPGLGRMGKKALIVTGKVMVKIGNCAKVEAVLKSQEVDCSVYSEIIGEPTDVMIENGLKQYKADGCDFLVAIGGGSPIDSMKAIGALVENGGSICDFYGKTIDIVFPSMGCRFIALNDGVDTIHKNNEMLVILKNVMNDLYARDTSSKIRAVKQSTFKSGKYVGCYAPIGYRKSPADKHILEIDPVTAPVVLRIFDMRLQGDSFRKIARTLNEEGIPSPRGFYYMAEGRPNLRGETPYWNDVTVKTILQNEVYLGHMVQNKTGTVSYKVHKQVSKPREDWIKVEHTHEPLVSQEVWDAVQRLDNHPSKGRSGSDRTISLFAGVLYCADCGGSMRYQRDYRSRKRHTDGHFGGFHAYACNRYMSGGKAACTSHYINCKVLTKLLLLDIHAKAMLAQNSPAALKEKILAQKNAASLEQTKALRATLAAVDKRLAELEKLVVSAYEDKVKGIMPEALCVQLMNRYEDERRSKLEQRTQLTA